MRRASLQQQQEDPVTFGNRLRFIDMHCGDSVMPWPCLHFANVQELLAVLRSRGMIQCPHMIRRVNVEYLKHLQLLRSRRQRQDKYDPVVFLFGSKTPGGSRLIFPSEHHNVQDYKESISRAVDLMQSEPCFMDALNDTSPILGNLLAAEMQAPDRLPDAANGEHAPAA
jgi:hypothetical protein